MCATDRQQVLEAGGLQVRFLLAGDRYAHEIWLADDDNWVPALVSVEGTPADDWPASPPLQSLDVTSMDDGRPAALLLGMAGHSHWSASVMLDAVARSVHFDLACRVRGELLGSLGSTYRAQDKIVAADATKAILGRLHAAASQSRAGWQLDVCREFGETQLTFDGSDVRIAAARASSAAAAQTVRWGYTIRLVPAAP